PILSASIVDFRKVDKLCNELNVLFKYPGFDSDYLDTIPYMIQVTNTGRGEIRDFSLSVVDLYIVNNPPSNGYELKLQKPSIMCDEPFNFFPVNGSNYMLINIPKQTLPYSTDDSIRIGVTLDINISSFVGEITYKYRLNFYINISLTDSSKETTIDCLTISYSGKEKKRN
ncbi:MAG: hypothetical protein RR585_14675, partial [Coprobacillus sp.]